MENAHTRSWRVAGVIALLMFIGAACSAAASTATPVPTLTPTATVIPAATSSPTATVPPTSALEPTSTPKPTPIPEPTATVYVLPRAPDGPVNEFTRVVIDGSGAADWDAYPVIVAPLPNQPEFEELRAFYNDAYLYLLITVDSEVRVDLITVSLDIGGDIDPEYFFLVTVSQDLIQLGRWPPVGATLRPTVGSLGRGTVSGFQVFEAKLPLDAIDPFGAMLVRVRTSALGFGASGVSEFITDRLPELEQPS